MGLLDGLAYLAYGPGHGRKSAGAAASQIIPYPNVPNLPQRQSWVFDSHITTEAASSGNGFNRGKAPQTMSLAWDERDAWGLDLASRSWQGLTPTERKSILLDIYINNPHVSSSVDVISKRIFSGGFTVEKVDEEAPDNQDHYDQLMEFCLRVNPDWDFNQYGRASIQDELIYGECYAEILWKNGLPFNLLKVDCLTMGYKPDRFGRIDTYYQEMPSTSKINYLDPNTIIRWWFPHPRASIDPFAPAEKVSDAVLIDKKMMNWMITFFQKGARFQYYIKGVADRDEADRFMTWYDNNVAGAKNAHRPPVTWGNAEFAPLGNAGALEMDFQKGLDRMRTIVYGAFGVPPAAVAIIESGSIGGGTGEDQDKSLIFNACDPVKQQWLEKLNYRVVQQGFGITDYRIGTRYADYRSDESVAKVQDMRIRNGSRTVDETRQEDGKRPYRKGGSVPIIITTKEVTPLPRIDDLEDEQRQIAQQTLAQGDLNNQMLQTKVEQAKNPPPAQPPALQQPQQGQAHNQQQANTDNKNVINNVNQPGKPAPSTGKKVTNTIAGKTTQTKEDVSEQSTDDSFDDFDDPDKTESMPAIKLKKQKQEADATASQAIQQIWQPPDIDKRLALLREKGVATKEWRTDANPCPICLSNEKQTVGVEEVFPSGHYDVPAHPHCSCSAIYRDAQGQEVKLANLGDDYR